MTGKYVVITNLPEDEQSLSESMEKLGLKLLIYPTIKISQKKLSKSNKQILKNIEQFGWVLFTSKNGVRFFMEYIKKNNRVLFKGLKIGVVGPKTAEVFKLNHLAVNFIPSVFTTENLGNELPEVRGVNILLLQSEIAGDFLTKILKTRGANVTNISIYTNEFHNRPNNKLDKLMSKDKVAYITFTSPSTIKGFLNGISIENRHRAFKTCVLAIGPVTARAAKDAGFLKVIMADSFTSEGMIKKLQEIM